jgi:cytoskeletal protein RodZ
MTNEPNNDPTEAADTKSADRSISTEESQLRRRQWRGHLTSVALVVVLCATVAVLTWFSITFYREKSSRPQPSTPASWAVVPAPKPPPAHRNAPAPSTVSSSASVPPKSLSTIDRGFLSDLQHYGLSYPQPSYPITHAKALCKWVTEHPNEGAVNYVQDTTIWKNEHDADSFSYSSVMHYCPQFVSEVQPPS